MSRYTIPQEDPTHEAVVGFCGAMRTFFAQIFDLEAPDDADECVYWIGATPSAIPTVEALQAQLGDLLTIPEEICQALRADQRNAEPPTALQQWVLGIFTTSQNRKR